jgi:hypothetical protein
VRHFSGYAGANITVLNVQSYPVVGGEWVVRFTTTGSAPLTVTPILGTAFGTDLEFKSIKCNDTEIPSTFNGTSVSIDNYSCDLEGTEASQVLTEGKHHLEFRFGDAVAYANNTATNIKYYLYTNNSDIAGYKRMSTDSITGSPWSEYSLAYGGCFAPEWLTPPLNTTVNETVFVNGTYSWSFYLDSVYSVAGHFTYYTSILKYNASGEFEIGRGTSGSISCGFDGLTNMNVPLSRSGNTILRPGERIGTRICIQNDDCYSYNIYYNRSDSYLYVPIERSWCNDVPSNLFIQ